MTNSGKNPMRELNFLGESLSSDEQTIWQIYQELKDLAGREDLSPCVVHNVRSALAIMWQVINDLNIEFEQLDEVKV